MESSRAKIVGPAIAAGAVSLGLILIGACGVGRHDTYVAPPPLDSGLDAAPAVVHDGTTATVPKVIIPPSPSWRVAPIAPPRRTLDLTDPLSITESSTRAPRSSTPRAGTSSVPIPPPVIDSRPPSTTHAQPTYEPPATFDEPTTTRRPAAPSDDE